MKRLSTLPTSRVWALGWPAAALTALLFVLLTIGGLWELFEGGAHTRHLLSWFLAVLFLALSLLVADYTTRRAAVAEIQAFDDRLRSALLAGHSVVWDWDLKTRRASRFGDLKTIFGISSETMAEPLERFYDDVHPEDRQRVSDAVDKAREDRSPYATEFRVIHKDGTIHWVNAVGEFRYSKNGTAVRMVGLSVDITERKKAQQALVSSEEKFSKAFRGSPVVLTLTSARDHRYLDVNDTFCELTGWEREEIIGRTPFDINIWADPAERKAFAERVAAEKSLRGIEVRYRCRDGTQGVGLASAEIIEIEGEPCILSAIVVITDRKQSEEDLRLKEAELAESQRLAHLGSWKIDLKSRELSWSEELYHVHGLDPKLPPPRYDGLCRLFTPQSWDHLRGSLDEAIRTGLVPETDLEVVRPDGTTRWVSTRGYPIRNPQGEIIAFHGTTQDITERKNAEGALREKEHDLAEAQRLAHLGSWEWDINSGVITWSEELYRIYGLDPSLPAPTSEELPKLYTGETWKRLQQAMESRSFPDLEMELIRPDGTKRWVETRFETTRDSAGVITKFRGVSRDITEEKLTRDQLRENEARMNAIINSAMDAIITVDDRQQIVLFNAAAEKMFQCPANEAVGAPLERFIFPANRAEHFLHFLQFGKNGETNRAIGHMGKLYALRPNGEAFPMEASISRADSSGRAIFTVIIRDITERLHAEEALRESEQKFRRVVEHIGDAVISDDAEGRITFANDRFLELFGLRREQLSGLGFENYIAPEFRDELRDLHSRRLRGEAMPTHFEYEGLRVDGSRMWLEVDVAAVTDSEGKIVGTQSAITNITDRKRAQQALLASEQRLRQLIESSHDWIYEMDGNGAYTYAGPQCRELLGYEPAELIGRTPLEFMPSDEARQFRETFQRLFAEPKPFSGLKTNRVKKDGRLVVWETNGVPIFDSKGAFRGYRGMVRDITDRHRAEQELRESEERFRRVVEHIGDALAVDNIQGRIVFANDQFLNLFGFRRDEIDEVQLDDYVAPEYQTLIRDRHDRLMRGEEVVSQYEYEGVRRDGNKVWLETNIVVIHDRERKIIGSQKILRDVTQRKKSEQTLRESEERLRHLIDSSHDWVWEVDANGVYTYAGPQCRAILGYEAAELIGKTPFELMPSDEAARIAAVFNTIAAERKPIYTLRNVNLHKDGHQVVLETNGVPLLNAEGTLLGYRGLDRDITERDRAEQALRESEERFRLVANTAPVMIWMSGKDAACNYFNKTWLDFTGRGLEQELGDGWAESVHALDRDACIKAYLEAFERKSSFEMQYRLRRHDGEYRWVLDIGVPRFDPDGTFAGYIGSCIDITDRKLAEETMATVGQRLIEAHEEERTWIGRELHDDINQRLSLLAVELEQWSLKSSSTEVQQRLSHAQQRIGEIAKDVQALSHRLHSSKLEYLGLAKAASSFCRELSQKSHVEISFTQTNVPRTLPKEVSLCLFRVLQEALQNAVKHSGTREFSVDLHGNPDAIELQVTDTGMGFEEHKAFTRQGLGLISMRERLQLVRGEFSVKSKPGAGTTIHARVPLPPDRPKAMAG